MAGMGLVKKKKAPSKASSLIFYWIKILLFLKYNTPHFTTSLSCDTAPINTRSQQPHNAFPEAERSDLEMWTCTFGGKKKRHQWNNNLPRESQPVTMEHRIILICNSLYTDLQKTENVQTLLSIVIVEIVDLSVILWQLLKKKTRQQTHFHCKNMWSLLVFLKVLPSADRDKGFIYSESHSSQMNADKRHHNIQSS